jgi:hypothetical protein
LKFQKMPAIIRHHISFAPKSGDDALVRPGEMTTSEAAALAECSMENIRLWIRKYRIGRWEPRLQMYLVDGDKLVARMNRRRRRAKTKLLAEAK